MTLTDNAFRWVVVLALVAMACSLYVLAAITAAETQQRMLENKRA